MHTIDSAKINKLKFTQVIPGPSFLKTCKHSKLAKNRKILINRKRLPAAKFPESLLQLVPHSFFASGKEIFEPEYFLLKLLLKKLLKNVKTNPFNLRETLFFQSGISGATVIGTLSSVAFLVLKDDSDEGIFIYDSYIDQTNANIAKPVSVPFAVTGNQTSFLQADGGLGCLVVWDSKDVSYSTVSGKVALLI